jgi:hypothetical protein
LALIGFYRYHEINASKGREAWGIGRSA